MTQKNKVHQRIFSIVWGDMDALGHVNNARYFDYFQEARIEWLATLNIDLKKYRTCGYSYCLYLFKAGYLSRYSGAR